MEKTDFLIDYYTGTGGSQYIAEQLAERFRSLGKEVRVRRIVRKHIEPQSLENVGCYILIFAVHAFNAPKPVGEWVRALRGNNTPVAIISVSGAGEVITNTACRRRTRLLLKKRGFSFQYENMVQMPNSWIAVPKKQRLFSMINKMPAKIEEIFNDIVQKRKKRNKTYWFDIFLSALAVNEQKVTPKFGEKIVASSQCVQCGLCVNNCCSSNITFYKTRVAFSNQCEMCLGCIYGCPQKALTATYGAFQVAKEGYDIKKMIKENLD